MGTGSINEKWQLLDASQVMAFGGGGNDIEMLEMAGHPCGGNAEEAVKAVAKHPAPSHQEGGGIYQVIEEHLGLTPGTSERKEADGGVNR